MSPPIQPYFAVLRAWLSVLALALGATTAGYSAVPNSGASDELVAVLARVGGYAERYFARAGAVMSRETVMRQPLGHDLTPDGHGRRLEYDLRVEWEPSVDGTPVAGRMLRTLLRVDGRPPKPGDDGECTDPETEAPEPLSMFLPVRQSDFRFTLAGTGKVNGRRVRLLDYREVKQGAPEIAWKESCVSVNLPGRGAGRAWVDPASGEVLRLDEFVGGPVEIEVPKAQLRPGLDRYMVFERSNVSIRYKPVTFHDPEETLLMPASIDTLAEWRHSGTLRYRITQTFTNYRRFVTGGRLVVDGAPEGALRD